MSARVRRCSDTSLMTSATRYELVFVARTVGRTSTLVDLREDGLLDGEVFRDRLDDHLGVFRNVADAGHEVDAVHDGRGILLREAAAAD